MLHDVIILGAGASGLVCAGECAKRGRKTLVLDHAREPGRKVHISGGGRCNVTNRRVNAADYVCANPHFVKSALSQYPARRILDFLHKHGLDVVEEDHGRLFCSKGAKDLVNTLAGSAQESGAWFQFNEQIKDVRREGGRFYVRASSGLYNAQSLIVATGGPAWPQIGASDLGHHLARSLGLTVTQTRPGLAPLRASSEHATFCRSLTGIALRVRIVIGKVRIDDALLFTHHGISGPAALDASLYWQPGQSLSIDLCPDQDIALILGQNPRKEIRNALSQALPSRLAALFCEIHGWSGQVGTLSKKVLAAMDRLIHAFPFIPAGTEGFIKAEVTMGGVDTDQISSKTMEAKTIPGLYFTGEVLDVAGRLGGYNLQWAWSSGFVAGQWA